jgi:hypothetical protein
MRMTLPLKRLLVLTVAIGLAACAHISYDRDDSIPIRAGATVAIAGGKMEGRENLDPAVDNDTVHRRIQNSIVAELRSKGFKVVEDPATADFLVRYFVGVNRDTQQVRGSMRSSRTPVMGPGWGFGWSGGQVTTLTPLDFNEVQFIVDLVQRSTGNTAWRAVWHGNPGANAPTQEEIDSKMSQIFRSAPVAG